MARHKRSYTGERLTAGVHVKCTPNERQRLDAAASERGVTLSDYTRRLLLRHAVAHPGADTGGAHRNPEAAALCEQVRRLGVNLNEIARYMNMTGQLRDVPELRDLCTEIKSVFARIIQL
jgi:hypothetical protein